MLSLFMIGIVLKASPPHKNMFAGPSRGGGSKQPRGRARTPGLTATGGAASRTRSSSRARSSRGRGRQPASQQDLEQEDQASVPNNDTALIAHATRVRRGMLPRIDYKGQDFWVGEVSDFSDDWQATTEDLESGSDSEQE